MLTSYVVCMFKFMEAFKEFILEHKDVVEQMLEDGKFSQDEEKIIKEVL